MYMTILSKTLVTPQEERTMTTRKCNAKRSAVEAVAGDRDDERSEMQDLFRKTWIANGEVPVFRELITDL